MLQAIKKMFDLAAGGMLLLCTLQCGTKNRGGYVFPRFLGVHSYSGPASQADKERSQVSREAWITMQVKILTKAAVKIRQQVQRLGGKIIKEELSYRHRPDSTGFLQIHILPQHLDRLLDWLPDVGMIKKKQVKAHNVSDKLYAMNIALINLKLTLNRLLGLMKAKGITVSMALKIEKELTRIRGKIEKLKGTKRWLEKRVAHATVNILLKAHSPMPRPPRAKFRLGLRMPHLFLFQDNNRIPRPLGGGLVVHFNRRFTIELDLFPHQSNGKNILMITGGGSVFSDFLGGGRRRWLNPYLGGRIGYGYLHGRNAFLVAGEVGLEIYKSDYLLLELQTRMVTFIGEGGLDLALLSALLVKVAF